jgi:hypothetical protein
MWHRKFNGEFYLEDFEVGSPHFGRVVKCTGVQPLNRYVLEFCIVGEFDSDLIESIRSSDKVQKFHVQEVASSGIITVTPCFYTANHTILSRTEASRVVFPIHGDRLPQSSLSSLSTTSTN